jgi:hypothetical protein
MTQQKETRSRHSLAALPASQVKFVHVLVTADTLSGTWTYTRELVSGLVSRGLRVTLVSFGEIPLPQQTLWMDNLHGLEYRPTAFRLDWMEEGQQDLKDSSDYLTALVKELKPDVLHLNQLCYGDLRVPVPRVVVAHGDLITWWRAVLAGSPSRIVGCNGIAKGHARLPQRRGGALGLDAGHCPRLLHPLAARHRYLQRAQSDFLQSLRG